MKRQSIINYLNRNATKLSSRRGETFKEYSVNTLFGNCKIAVGIHNVLCSLDTPNKRNRFISFNDVSTGNELMGRISANILAVAREHGGEI